MLEKSLSPTLQEVDTKFSMIGLLKQFVSACNGSLKIFWIVF